MITQIEDVPLPELNDASIDSAMTLADDVLGSARFASLTERPVPIVVDLTEPIVVDALEGATALIESHQIINFGEIAVNLPVEIEPTPTPVDDLVTEHADFAAVLANEITPAQPDTLSFEP